MSGLVDERGEPIQAHLHPADPDELLKLRDALAKAYTAAFALNQPRSQVTRELRETIGAASEIISTHIAELEAIVRARTIGNRCGDFISQQQLALLKDAMKE